MVDKEIADNTAVVVNESLGLGIDPSAKDLDTQVRAKYIEISKADLDMKEKAAKELFNNLKKEYIDANIADGVQVTEISGIEKIDDYTCTVLVDGVNIIGDRLLAQQYVMPQHYYGVADDGTEFKKGDMTIPKSRNSAPMGSGAYIQETLLLWEVVLIYLKNMKITLLSLKQILIILEEHQKLLI